MSGPAEAIIMKFGGINRMARLLGHRHPSTVQGWKQRGTIPIDRVSEIMELARRENVDLRLTDFIPSNDSEANASEAAA